MGSSIKTSNIQVNAIGISTLEAVAKHVPQFIIDSGLTISKAIRMVGTTHSHILFVMSKGNVWRRELRPR